MALQSRILTRFFESAQKKVEAMNFGIRKNILEYDDVLNRQRHIIYEERNKVLNGTDIHTQITEMLKDYVFEICSTYLDPRKPSYEWELEPLNNALEDKLLEKGTNLVTKDLIEDSDTHSASLKIYEKILEQYEAKIEEVKAMGFDFAIAERGTLLRVVDKFWTDHIDAMNTLRNEIGVQAYGQHDPVIAYKNEGFDMFDKMISDIREYTASALFRMRVKVNTAPTRPNEVTAGTTNKQESQTVKAKKQSVGRNDPCPCGSGKKYKNCCGR